MTNRETNKPGSPDTETVNLSTGSVAFPVSLASLPGRNGFEFTLSISYSSKGVRQVVDTWNRETATGVLGLGWSFPQDKIMRMSDGVLQNSRYYLITENTVYPLLQISVDEDGITYASEQYEFWRIRYVPASELWLVTKEDGTRYVYGGGVQPVETIQKTSAGNAIEWGVRWGDWTGPSNAVTKQEQFPTAWNLTCIEDIWGNPQVTFAYEQDQQFVGTGGAGRKKYTQACRLSQITSATGQKMALYYGPETGADNPYETRLRRHVPPEDGDGADAYQDRQEIHFLDALEVRNAQDELLTQVQFYYASLGSDRSMQKQILKMITQFNRDGHRQAPPQTFTYYGEELAGEELADGVSVSLTDTKHLFHEGALFGALESVLMPQGATISYQYEELLLPQTQRDIEIQSPGDEWVAPRTYFGLDYVVVIWRGIRNRYGQLHVSAYQWCGGWVRSDSLADSLGIPGATGSDSYQPVEDHIHVEVAADFFAIVIPESGYPVYLFHKKPFTPGQWTHSLQQADWDTEYLFASGANFFAALDTKTGRLHCFTWDGESWRSDPVFAQPLQTGTDMCFGLTAGDTYLCTVSAAADQKVPPEIRFYALGPLRTWRTPIIHQCAYFFTGAINQSETLVVGLSLEGSTHFVSLLVSGLTDHRTFKTESYQDEGKTKYRQVWDHEYTKHYRHFVYRWTETTLETEELRSFSQDILQDRPPKLVVVGDTMIVAPFDGDHKMVYHYTGEGWYPQMFDNDSVEHNYVGYNSFSTTKDGKATYREFNPNTGQWYSWDNGQEQSGQIPPYKDGNPTLLQKIWNVLYFIENIITLPLELGTGLLLDVVSFLIDWVIAMVSQGGDPGSGGEAFFTADNHVYYHDLQAGTWNMIGELRAEEMFQDQIISLNTQTGSRYIPYIVTLETGNDYLAGKSVSMVQLLKNGTFYPLTRNLAREESLLSSHEDETTLIGSDAFVTFLTAPGLTKLRTATALKLHRVIQDDIQGPLQDCVVSRVKINDGYVETHTHYKYEEASAVCLPATTAAIYHKVTAIYSGASTVPNKSNGYTDSWFYVGEQADSWFSRSDPDPSVPPHRFQLSALHATNAADYPALMTGRPYYTAVYDASGNPVSTTAQYWYAFQKSLASQYKGSYIRLVRTETWLNDSSTRVIEQVYRQPDESSCGLPERTVTYNYNVLGEEEKHETVYTYGGETYPELKARHVLTPVTQTATYVNTILTGISAIEWLPTLLSPLRLIPGQDLPPEFQGNGWAISDLNTLSASSRDGFRPGTPETSWQAEISPLVLTAGFAAAFLFTYDCSVTLDYGIANTELEVWVDGQKVWSDGGVKTHFSGSVTLPVAQKTVEWLVSCTAQVPANNTGHLVNRAGIVVSIRDLHISLLAPGKTHQKRDNSTAVAVVADQSPDAAQHNHPAPDAFNDGWLQTSAVVSRNPTYGIVTESSDVDGVIHSVLYDREYRFPVATFIHASIENHEAGYYGFEDYEQEEQWRITGTARTTAEAHAGMAALSGQQVRIEPKVFTSRTPETPYIVSAWVKMDRRGTGAQIGFGQDVTSMVASDEDWHYIEHVTSAPRAEEIPFACCDGTIDDFRFGPVDAPFTAMVYDPIYHHITEQLGTNGETVRFLYDDHPSLIATTGPDGREVLGLITIRDSRNGGKVFNPEQPNLRLTLAPRNRGQYHRTLPSPISTDEGYKQDFSPQTANYGIKLRVFSVANPSQAQLSIQFGDANVIRVDHYGVRLTRRAQAAKDFTTGSLSPIILSGGAQPTKKSTKGSSSSKEEVMGEVECLLLVLESKAFFFLDGKLIFCEPINLLPGAPLSIHWEPLDAISCSDIFLLADPIIELAYTDGLGRVIQTRRLDDTADGEIVRQVLYDGWGNPAVLTKPMQTDLTLAYQADLVETFDWEIGQMQGKLVDYYRQEGHQAVGQKQDDALYPYIRQVAEASPLARIIETQSPGVEFKAGSPLNVRATFGQPPDLTRRASRVSRTWNASIVTAHAPFEGQTQAVFTRAFDLQGRLIVQQSMVSGNPTTLQLVRYEKDGTMRLITKQPAMQMLAENDPRPLHYMSTAHTDYLGRIVETEDCDCGAAHYLYDRAGRLRFKLDADGVGESTDQIQYWKYDALGRRVEEGIVLMKWEREQLQSYAESDAAWPPESTDQGVPLAVWKSRLMYDMAPEHHTSNLKGRLQEWRTRDAEGKEVREAFEYDLAGNVITTSLTVEAFDLSTRVTRYTHDQLGNTISIAYPSLPSDQPGVKVQYSYNVSGRLASIGTVDDPTRYATYTYTPNGNMQTELLNRKRLQLDYHYDFQGRLHEIREPGGLFSEVVSYRDAHGTFKDGNIARTDIQGSALSHPCSYAYQYDQRGQLKAAQVQAGSNPSQPNSEMVSSDDTVYQYDNNGNITLASHRSTSVVSIYGYRPGINQVETISRSPASGAPAEYFYSPGGRLRRSDRLEQVHYDALTGLPLDISAGQQSMHLHYDGRRQRVLKIITGTGQNEQHEKRLYLRGINSYPLSEKTDSGEIIYIYGPGGLIAQSEDAQTFAFFLKDHLGSTRVVLDEANQPLATFNYLTFGSVLQENSSLQDAIRRFRYLYTGQEYDREIDLYNYRARMYDSAQGRFLTPDPRHEFASPYVYVNNNPINLTDPTGELWTVARSGQGAVGRAVRMEMHASGSLGMRTTLPTGVRLHSTGPAPEGSSIFDILRNSIWPNKTPVPGLPKVVEEGPLVLRTREDAVKVKNYRGKRIIWFGVKYSPLPKSASGELEEVTDLITIKTHMHNQAETLELILSSGSHDPDVAAKYAGPDGFVYGMYDPNAHNPEGTTFRGILSGNLQAERMFRNLSEEHTFVRIEGEALPHFLPNWRSRE